MDARDEGSYDGCVAASSSIGRCCGGLGESGGGGGGCSGIVPGSSCILSLGCREGGHEGQNEGEELHLGD